MFLTLIKNFVQNLSNVFFVLFLVEATNKNWMFEREREREVV